MSLSANGRWSGSASVLLVVPGACGDMRTAFGRWKGWKGWMEPRRKTLVEVGPPGPGERVCGWVRGHDGGVGRSGAAWRRGRRRGGLGKTPPTLALSWVLSG
jgi:hypothetical protein